jgi:hypothetical protein
MLMLKYRTQKIPVCSKALVFSSRSSFVFVAYFAYATATCGRPSIFYS